MTDAFLSESDIEQLREKYLIKPGRQPDKTTLSQQEFDEFVATVQRRKLDPFARQFYWTKRWSKDAGWTFGMEATIDGFRVLSERTGQYRGQVGPFWCGPDGQWQDVWLDSKPPRAAKVGILRAGNEGPTYAVALWDSYVQKGKGGDVSYMWVKMGPSQLGKCAEALARRITFPQDLSGLYTVDEMGQADNEAAPVAVKKQTPPKTATVKAPPVEEAPPAVEEAPEPPPVEVAQEAPPVEEPAPDEPTNEQRLEFKALAKALGLNREQVLKVMQEACGKITGHTGTDIDKVLKSLRAIQGGQ